MGKIIAEITMSLDGFIAGEDISKDQPMGREGQSLHHWLFRDRTEASAALLEELMGATGAVILGNTTYTTAIDGAWEGASPFPMPAFLLCHAAPRQEVKGFTYITDGIQSALEKARLAAGDKDIWIMGGAAVLQQYLAVGLVEELQIHIAPMLLGKGTPLFGKTVSLRADLQGMRVIETGGAVHLRYKVLPHP